MEFEKAAEAFRRKELELDFATITIAQCIETDPATYTGPGYFRQDASGKLEVKCYATTTPQMGIAAFNRQMRSSSAKTSSPPASAISSDTQRIALIFGSSHSSK